MKIQFRQSILREALSKTYKVTAKSSTLPILGNVLIEAKDEDIILTASNLEQSLRLQAEGEVIEEGAITVPAKRLFDIVKVLDGEIMIATEENDRVKITSDDSYFQLIGISDEEFPENLFDIEQVERDIDILELITKLERVSFSAATDESRYFLNGVHFGDEVFCATDSRRLAVTKTGLFSNEDSIVPLGAIQNIMATFGDEQVTGTVAISDNKMVLESGDTCLSTRLIDGEYPHYKEVMPDSQEITVTVDKSEFADAVRRVALLVNPKTYGVFFDFEGDTCRIHARTPQLGEAEETVEIEKDGKDLKVQCDVRYMQDIIKHVEAEDVVLQLTDQLSPMTVEDKDTTFLVMPMRVD